MYNVDRWPADPDKLSKGDVIPIDRIEEITGLKFGDPIYSLAACVIAKRIEREMHAQGKFVTVRCLGGTIKVLTDAEAAAFNHRQVQSHRKKLLRRHFQNMAVDVANLDGDQKLQHDRDVELDGKYVSALTSVSAQLKFQAVCRNIPGLPPVE